MNKSLLLILDGCGWPDDMSRSAVTPETMPCLFELAKRHGCAPLAASGPEVGLDVGQAGNSEVGHLTLGAGRLVPGALARIAAAHADGSWLASPVWTGLKGRGRVHVAGLLSDAGTHAHLDTLVRTCELARRHGVQHVAVHVFLDGVDSPAGSAPRLLAQLNDRLSALPGVRLATVSGRTWACDRSGKREITLQARAAMRGEAAGAFSTEALQQHLAQGLNEANFPAHVVEAEAVHRAGEPIVLTSHRADRITQLANVLAEDSPVYSMVELKGGGVPIERVFFPTRPVTEGLIDRLRAQGIDPMRISEDCKFPHVTWFMNGLRSFEGTPSVKVPSIAESEIRTNPAMSIERLTQEVLSVIEGDLHRAMVVNIPNLDQVGHTGDMEATRAAARHVDQALRQIVDACQRNAWSLVVTADHGNADCMLAEDGRPVGSHSSNKVPLIVVGPQPTGHCAPQSLADVAPVYLKTLGLHQAQPVAELALA